MPIVVGLAALGALVYGVVWAFGALRAAFGVGVAVGVAVLAALLVAAGLAYWLRRRKEVAPNVRDGDWTHSLQSDWGSVRIAAVKRFLEIRLGSEVGSYIFADLVKVDLRAQDGGWQVVLQVKDARHGVWVLPMRDKGEATRWWRVLGLAVREKL
ncbi:hypothetical protein LFL96_07415 [Paraburkholderia sp. D15]|uniref:hypothetical protein n=1 Tax=Paraburkholderia sp. D15 TaxID=2880218 RepID=UPI0024793D22|nr:hypothetical protein [Paraburkholderia sp. D15]WGS51323.1 hypothetical protein LFL96_07415 [Paraburkholderia sp. D15]